MTLSNEGKQMILALQFVSGYGGEFRSWRLPGASTDAYTNMDYQVSIAKKAEEGKIHMIFSADTPALTNDLSNQSPMHQMDPLVSFSAIARETNNIGLVSTVSTTYSYPYNTARTMKTLDVMSGGRIGWNAVSSSMGGVAENFGTRMLPREKRYDMAYEAIEAVQTLWGSFGEEAMILNKKTGEYVDMSKVRYANYNGEYFKTKGPLPIPPSPQGQPPIFQAGGGEKGIEMAGKYASGVYANPFTIADAKMHRSALQESAKRHGRSGEDIKMLTGFMFTIGDTEEEALERRRQIIDYAPEMETAQRVQYLGMMVNLRISINDIDINQPLPQELISQISPNMMDPRAERVIELIQKGLSVKDILAHGVINYHPVVAGTAVQVADFLEKWFTSGATDGFSIVPDSLHDGVEKFVEQVIPILQERGLFHKDYEGSTLRKNMGVPYQYGIRS
ncbi:LLM class flavin-dependent oxidoreductase [Staphylococcus succinus]|uniref:NtaA/DmoA family FMN-dependent monooxygenase n=1 Tax=Staphylococcus succinus TaxID=61015 RepID=UPI000E67A3C0|nr:NtaA/DmoA family FMN-dependent monooxygenase [Staphylococcus succinus]MEB8127713.1 NtaA/DmoA family FMN-dependent monooxygenase [Staphylococcus succinus]RIN32376.1 LLM class flavin-dependent oxidoreductase [Staphylococcus succinus]